ncbi:MAG: hypothetical protein KY445_02725 [Armatimonadetes bacterium]|nr:hypothetical protein [Armatimonadota bacterium]
MGKTIAVKIVRKDLKPTGARIRANLKSRVADVAEQMRDDHANALCASILPLQADTGALAASLAVQSEKKNDFSEKRADAKAAYLNNPSQWKEGVQANVSAEAYTEKHFEERAGKSAPPLPATQSVAQAAILTMLLWGISWEFGHQNVFTGKNEQRPWFADFMLMWWRENVAPAFAGLAN